MTTQTSEIDWSKSDGLVPAIVQHALTGRVLMLGYMNSESYLATQESGLVTFFSRSQQKLWTKGETSGNRLQVRRIELDCDRDTLLVQAIPEGPTCYLDRTSCFDGDEEATGFGFLGELEQVISGRLNNRLAGSYTSDLADQGVLRIAQKLGEEGVEVALAATQADPQALVEESADLVYHLLVLLRHQGRQLVDVVERLEQRHRERETRPDRKP